MTDFPLSPVITDTAEAFKALIGSVETLVIAGEASPDPDCAGSQLALRRICKQLSPKLSVWLLNDQGCPDNIRWHKDNRKLRAPKSKDKQPEMVIFVDGGVERCGARTRELMEAVPRKVLIDHHLMGSGADYELSIVDAQSPSTTALIFELACALGVTLDKPSAEALYMGLVSDTGAFQFSSTTAKTLRIAAALVDCGARPDFIAAKVRLEKPLDYLKLQGRLFRRLQRHCDDRVLISVVHDKDLKGLNLGAAPFDPIINDYAHIEGLEVAVMIKGGAPRSDQPWRRLSFRSRGQVNVAELARSLDPEGGGHAQASGCRLQGRDEDIIDRVLAGIKAQLTGTERR